MTTATLRTRLLVAAERFANEIADVIEESSGERERVGAPVLRKPKRQASRRNPRMPEAPASSDALAKADEILERHGLGRRTGS